MIHCRNCPVYFAAGRSLLDRRPPEGYLEDWSEFLAQDKETGITGTESVVIFRIGEEWLALPTRYFHEVTDALTIHSLPHRRNKVLLGLVNVRGELQLCVSLTGMLGLEEAEKSGSGEGPRNTRMAVIGREEHRWVFPVEEVVGVHRFDPGSLRNTPVTVSKASAPYTKGMIDCGSKGVGLLDEELLFFALGRSLT